MCFRSYRKQPSKRRIPQTSPNGAKALCEKEEVEAGDTGIAGGLEFDEDDKPPHIQNTFSLV